MPGLNGPGLVPATKRAGPKPDWETIRDTDTNHVRQAAATRLRPPATFLCVPASACVLTQPRADMAVLVAERHHGLSPQGQGHHHAQDARQVSVLRGDWQQHVNLALRRSTASRRPAARCRLRALAECQPGEANMLVILCSVSVLHFITRSPVGGALHVQHRSGAAQSIIEGLDRTGMPRAQVLRAPRPDTTHAKKKSWTNTLRSGPRRAGHRKRNTVCRESSMLVTRVSAVTSVRGPRTYRLHDKINKYDERETTRAARENQKPCKTCMNKDAPTTACAVSVSRLRP